MSILSIDETSDILTAKSLVHCARWQLVDAKFAHKLMIPGRGLDPTNFVEMEHAIENILETLPVERIFLPVVWGQILDRIIKLRYTKSHPGFQLRFKVQKWQGYAWETKSDRASKYYLDIKVIRTTQAGNLFETVNIKVWFKKEFTYLLSEYSNAIENTTIQL